MEDDIASAMMHVPPSEYGSDFSLATLSDYGSDIDLDDIEEDAHLSDLLVKIVAPASKDIVYPSIQDSVQHAHVLPHPRRQPVVQFEERAIQSSPLVATRASLEIEYDAPSRRAFSGTY